ncbi:MAG: hypothetical protein IJY01_00420 [Clostridia bacterium]|nr:hypothetical protein [Clostridia bacterium]
MAREVEYIIRISADANAQGDSEITENQKAPEAAPTSSGDTVSGKTSPTKKLFIQTAAYGYAKRALNTVVSNTINTVSLRTGYNEHQQRLQLAQRITSDAINIGESLVVGAMVGGLGGALVSAAITSTFKLVEYGMEHQRLQISREVDSIGLAQAQIRAGTGGDRQGRN